MPNNSDNQNFNYLHVSQVPPNIFTQKHIRSDYALIRVGTTADMPVKGDSQTSFYFDTELLTLNYWDKTAEAWVSTTLS